MNQLALQQLPPSPSSASVLDPRAALFVRAMADGHNFAAACQLAMATPAEVTSWESQGDGVFLRMLADARSQVKDASTTAGRIKIRAQRIVEDRIDTVGEIIGDIAAPAAARVSAFSAVKGLTGLDSPKDAAPAQSFKLNIVLPGGQPMVVEGQLEPPLVAAPLQDEDEQPVLQDGSDEQSGGVDWETVLQRMGSL